MHASNIYYQSNFPPSLVIFGKYARIGDIERKEPLPSLHSSQKLFPQHNLAGQALYNAEKK